MEAELGTAKVKVCAYIDEDAIPMTKAELLRMVNELHDKLAAQEKLRSKIRRIVGFGS